MPKLLQVDFTLPVSNNADMQEKMRELANSINAEPGVIWKIWTFNAEQSLGGGVYLFDTHSNAQQYLDMHSSRLTQMGITNIRGVIFDINESLSNINHAPLTV
ncbi:monooxygenase [Pseudoalteromonas sp. MMG012]|uniref:monooxygenase n=1 Tax=Pseudoalteromonas sp. MMG012 TaxID=2822686 RepID=UPI001B39DD1D|nr:monooxygenase [Pseudoalteromonas sp. MMG012]MBQ4851725.1 monooxygenase [Pseudoalteromonas sp. MMG012]